MSARTSDSSETSSDCYSGEKKTFPLLVSLTGVIVGATVAKEKWNCFYIFLRVAAINNTAQNVYSVIEKWEQVEQTGSQVSLHLSRVDFMGGGTGLNADGVIILQPSHSL